MSCPTSADDCLDIDLGRVAVGSTYRIQLTFLKDGDAWVGIDSVEFRLVDPEGNASAALTGVLVTPDAGVWYYDVTTTDIDEAGDWLVRVTVTDGAVVSGYPGTITLTAKDVTS